MNNPKKIYLSGEFEHNGELTRTWCEDQIEPCDTEYIRADLMEQLIEKYQDKVNRKIKIRNNSDSPENISIINRKLVVYQGIIDELQKLIKE